MAQTTVLGRTHHGRQPGCAPFNEDDMRPASTTQFSCVTCEVQIEGPPTFHLGLPFCCAGCAADGPCICSYDRDPGAARVRHCLDVADPVALPGLAPRSAVAAPRR